MRDLPISLVVMVTQPLGFDRWWASGDLLVAMVTRYLGCHWWDQHLVVLCASHLYGRAQWNWYGHLAVMDTRPLHFSLMIMESYIILDGTNVARVTCQIRGNGSCDLAS